MTQAAQERPTSPPPPTKRRKVDDEASPQKPSENGRAEVAPVSNGKETPQPVHPDHDVAEGSGDKMSDDRPTDDKAPNDKSSENSSHQTNRNDFDDHNGNSGGPGQTNRSQETEKLPEEDRENRSSDAVVRGPQETGGLDEIRPPRRSGTPGDGDVSPHCTPANDSHTASLGMEPTGLAPEVDAVLSRIFASGLFERKDIDGRALEFLGRVSPSLALAALEDIQRRDFSTVRNKPAFIMSIFKRVVAGGVAGHPSSTPRGGFAPTSVPASALAHLPPAVSEALQRVFASGVCHPRQFDDRAMDILVDLPEPDAVRALSEFAAMEPGRVRNPSAFWMGLARKYKGHSRGPSARMTYDGGPGGPGGPGPGGSYSGYDGGMGYDTRRSVAPGSGFSPALEQRLDELSASGHLSRSALDDRAMDALRRLPEQDALGVLGELPDPSRVRNMSAYVMGLCKKFASGEARSLSGRNAPYGGGGSGGGYSSAYGGGYAGSGGNGGGGGYGAPGGYGGYGGGSVAGGYPPGGYGGGPHGGYGASAPPYGVSSSGVGGGYGGGGMPHQGGDGSRARDVREALDGMDAAVKDRFYAMTDQGIINETSFDARAIDALQSMRREEACAALDELAASEPGRIHNISAYFMGLAKKFGRAAM